MELVSLFLEELLLFTRLTGQLITIQLASFRTFSD
jgi:hypothetical protein